MEENPTIYIKPTCPWCEEALLFLGNNKTFTLTVVDVSKSEKDAAKLQEISGQSSTPTFQYKNFIVSDFDISEFIDALKKAPAKIKEELSALIS